MNNSANLLKSLIVYAIIVPLAIFVGFVLTNPMQVSTFIYGGIFGLFLVFPLLLKWHQPLLLLSWNSSLVVFFLKGAPNLWLVMVTLSLGISLMERALNRDRRFIGVPQITVPLVCLIAVVLFTAKMNGGIGLRAFGSEVMGGKKYIFLIVGILSYFALTDHRIPPERAKLYLSLYLLGGLTYAIGDFYSIAPGFLNFIFWLFPPTFYTGDFQFGVTRLGGVGEAGFALWCWLLAIYGVRGIFLAGKLWRPVLLLATFALMFMGGHRLTLLLGGMIFLLMFFLEGIHRTRIMPVFVLLALMSAVAIVPLARHLPFTFQRALTFLPLNLDPEAVASAEDSSQWRIKMWEALLPEVPKYLLVGKGYAISQEDFDVMARGSGLRAIDASQQGLALAGDYHSGPFSVILPFGIWGAITFLWFMFAGLWVMYQNYKYGDPALQTVNTFLWVMFVVESFSFLFLFGALAYDMGRFLGPLGFSIALNGGVCRRVRAAAPDPAARPLPAARAFPRRPAFQR